MKVLLTTNCYILFAVSLFINVDVSKANGCTNSTWEQCDIPGYWYTDYNCSTWRPFTDYTMSNDTESDFIINGYHSFRTVMWFTDDIWTGTLADHRKILEQSFEYALMDIHDYWGQHSLSSSYQSITLDNFYVNVTYVYGFCLLDDQDECQLIAESDLETYEANGEIAGNRSLGEYSVYAIFYAGDDYIEYMYELVKEISYDYMAYASMRLQCHGFSNLLNNSYSMEEADLNYKGWALYVESIDYNSANPFQATFWWIVAICCCVANIV